MTSIIAPPEKEDREGLSAGNSPFSFCIGAAEEGLRVDQFLTLQFPDLSRSRIAAAIKDGCIRVDGRQIKTSHRLHLNESVAGALSEPVPFRAEPQQIDFEILYEDAWLLGIAKPPGLVVHPANGNPDGTLVNGLLYYCRDIGLAGDVCRPGIVHRLDKDTSGVMVVAKTDDVHRRLVALFKDRGAHKMYHALVRGRFSDTSGRISAPIGRHPVHRKKMAVSETGGRHAVTNWRLLETYDAGYSLLEVVIETGRTHQIRVHMAHIGHPVAGDALYGKAESFPRQMLHASRLAFQHPVTREQMDFFSPLWPDMNRAVSLLRQNEQR